MSYDDEVEVPQASMVAPAIKIEPVKVTYCGVCSWPVEYCEFSPQFEKCKEWMQQNCPDQLQKLLDQLAAITLSEKEKSKKLKVKAEKAGAAKKKIVITLSNRSKRKFVTTVANLDSHDVNLKDAVTLFKKKLACGCSITETATGENEIDIQGDKIDEVLDIIESNYKIPKDSVTVVRGK